MISPEASIHAAEIILPAVFALAIGFIAGRFSARRAVEDAELLAFVEQAQVSVQCLPGINGDDAQWAVTSGDRVAGMASFEIRDAIRSAAGAMHIIEDLL